MESNGKFRMSASFIENLVEASLSAQAQKLLLALVYLHDIDEQGWCSLDWEEGLDQPKFMPLAAFRKLGCAPRSNDARFFRTAAAELASATPFFDDLTVSPCGRNLFWTAGLEAVHLMSQMDRYALMEATDIGHCTGVLDAKLLCMIMLHRKMERPEFRIPIAALGLGNDSKVKAHVTRSFQKWGNLKRIHFVVGLEQRGSRPGVTDLLVRMRHAETRWPEGRITKRDPRTRLFEIPVVKADAVSSPAHGV